MSPVSLARRSLPPSVRARGVTAVLGPTNTGKTHLAIERMLGHESGMIGLPLRLLAREVYGRVVERAGAKNVALVTGEEKIKPERPRYWISTVEAMPRDLDLAFVAVDEIQLAADLDRGHVFTDRLLNQRGREETMLIGSSTMRPLIEALIPGVHVTTRPRLSKLSFAGEKKVSRLPSRAAIVAFSAEEVYAVAELIRRQRGGAAVVLGALSPRTRNAQVELFQNGDVQYLVATDAIGMGLNLDVDHVAFAADRKFDGFRFRKLTPSELGQIAGRAGRYLRDGTFGTSGRCPPFEAELVEALENHQFDPLRILQWRNSDLDFTSLASLQESLADQPREHGLVRAPIGEDVTALEQVARDDEIRAAARGRANVERLWQVCQVPDYRKVSPASHADLVAQLARFVLNGGRIPAEWFAGHVASLDRADGDIDTLSNRIAQVRTWTFVANRPDWLADPEHWQGVTRQVEDRLSDALHDRLAQRFVDRRTSVLMRRLRENAIMEAEITSTGDVTVEGQHVGHLHGFRFVPDPQAEGPEAKALRNAAAKALAGEIEARAGRLAEAPDATILISNDGTLRWQGDPVGKLEPGDKLFEPRVRLIADEQLTGPARDKVEERLRNWLKAHIARLLGPVLALEDNPELNGLARGIGFQIGEALGVLERAKVLNDVRALDQEGRAALRKLGVRFGAYHLYLPALLKPAPRTLAAQLWALRHGGLDQKGIDEIAYLAGSGRTSMAVDPEIAVGLYKAAGFRALGARAVRVDILERLADLIRPAIAYRPGVTPGEPPPGTADGDAFVPTVSMTSLVGCSGEDFATILRSLGYAMERRAGPAITVPLVPLAPKVPAGAAANGVAENGVAAGEPAAGEAADAPAMDEGGGAAAASDAAEAPPQPVQAVPDETAAEPTGEAETPAAEAAAPEAPLEEGGEAPQAEGSAPEPETSAAPEPDAPGGISEAAPASAEVGAEAAPAEPVLIEVWRQRRHHREGGQARPGRGDRNRRDERRGADRRPPRTDRPAAADRGLTAGPAAEGAEPRAAEARPPRPDRPRGPHPERRDGPRPPRSEHRGPPQGGRRERREEGRTDFAPRPERREKAPDPNSPFAKLAALKAQLEGRDGNKG